MHRIIIRQHQAAAILFTLIGAALLLFLIFSAAMSSSAAAGTIIHVDKDAALGGDGTTWGTAYKYLQDGLAAATSGDEIWVAEGIYYPDEDEGGNVTDNDRNASFNFKDSVEIFGGFAGSETSRDERDWETNLTVLSGDIDKNDSGKVSGVLQSHSGITGDNSYHVVLASNIDLALLDGFAITGGDADYGNGSTGGGIYLNQSNDIILANLNIRGNRAIVGFGGGISIENGNGLIISRSTIRNNFAEISGGGIKLGGASVLIEASYILENEAREPALSCLVDVSGGGGLQIGGGSTTLNDVVFEKNLSDCVGGGIAMNRGALYMHGGAFLNNKVRPSLNSAGGGLFTINSGTVAIENALFKGNIAKARGGAVNLAYAGNRSSKNLRFTNTTIVANEADSYGAIILNANTNTELTLANMIVADNINSNAFVNDGNIFVANSLVQDSGGSGVSWNTAFGTDQGGNIDTVPGFIQPPIGAAPNVSGDFRLSLGSPAIDAGLNSAVTSPPTMSVTRASSTARWTWALTRHKSSVRRAAPPGSMSTRRPAAREQAPVGRMHCPVCRMPWR